MKYSRDVLFIGLVLGGAAALHASLFPSQAPPRASHYDPGQLQRDGIAAVAGQVDAAYRRQWAAEKIAPAALAPELAVLRRLHLGLAGTIPSLQEIRQFEAYQGEGRLDWWLTNLLDDRRHADYFAERLARIYVGTEDGPFIVFRRRRFVYWLSDQIKANRNYGDVARDLIAGQGLWTDNPGTNFITVTFDQDKGRPDPERLAGRVARAFLGIRLDCAQCHDHKFVDDWKQTDFQALAAFFGRTRQGFTGIYDAKEGEHKYESNATRKEAEIQPAVPFCQDLLASESDRRQQLANWVVDKRNPYFARAMVQRVWALMFSKPMLGTVEWERPIEPLPQTLEILARDFTEHGYDLRRLIRTIAATEIFRLDSRYPGPLTEKHEETWAVFPMTRLRPEQAAGSILQAASLQTINTDSNILVRIQRTIGENEFVKRYGDTGADEFSDRSVTVPQALLLMNGELVTQQTRPGMFTASFQIAGLSPDNKVAVEAAYLAVLTRRPTPAEATHFEKELEGKKANDRARRFEDIYWSLINSPGFSWNH